MTFRHQTLHHFSDGQYIKEMRYPAGWSMGKHVHPYSHFSILAQGAVTLTVDGQPQELVAPAIVNVAAGCEHVIHCHSDTVWLCTHAIADTAFAHDPSTVDEFLISKGG